MPERKNDNKERVSILKYEEIGEFLSTINGDLGENNTNFVEIGRKRLHYSDNREPTMHVSLAIGWKDEKGVKKYKKSFLVNMGKFSGTKIEVMGLACAFAGGVINQEQFLAMVKEANEAPAPEAKAPGKKEL